MQKNNPLDSVPHQAAPLWRYIAAGCYDSMLLIALWFAATAALLPFTDGEAIPTGTYAYGLYLLVISYLFFSIFWAKGGQTLGMQSWRIYLCDLNGQPPSFRHASLRFMGTIFALLTCGLSHLYMFTNKERRTFHDKTIKTQLVYLPKKAK